MARTIYSFRYRLTFISDEGHQASPWVYGEHKYKGSHGRRGNRNAYQAIQAEAFVECALEGAASPAAAILAVVRAASTFARASAVIFTVFSC